MSTMDEKEREIVDRLGETLMKLDDSLGKMESTDSRVKGWYEQEKAIHQLKKTIRESERYDTIAGGWDETYRHELALDDKHLGKALVKINRRLAMLDETLEKLEDSDIGRLKGWYEQRVAIHDVKKILHQIEKFDAYDRDEMSRYTST